MREIREPGGEVEAQMQPTTADGCAAAGPTLRRTFRSGVDAVVPPVSTRSLTAPVVFAGYGIRESAPARDDWRGLDVKGRIVVLREGVPPGPEWRTKALLGRWADGDAEERWAGKVEIARSLGAVAVLAVEGEAWTERILGKEKPWPFAFRGLSDPEPDEPLVVRLSPAAGELLLGGTTAEDRPRSLPGLTVTIRATGLETLAASRNVIGFLEGSDPALRREAVVLGAHVDHLGRVDGAIHPGADDNASGTAALLEIAHALAASPVRPKRTIVFAFWTGEEEDKIGSSYWVAHPLWPLERTAAYLNFDMIGHPWTPAEIRELVKGSGLPDADRVVSRLTPETFAEPGVASFARWLGPVVSRAGRGTGLALHLDWTAGTHGGSDYRAFARARVPFVRFFGDFFPAYHEAGDTAESLDPAQVGRIARLGLATAWLLADR